MSNGRMRRVNAAVQEVLAEAIGELRDPRIGFVTVTGVETSPDLAHATVFVSVLGSERKRDYSLAGLAAAWFTIEIGQQTQVTIFQPFRMATVARGIALIIVAALGGSLVNEILAIGVALTPNFVRLARSLTLTIRETDYVMAARAIGAGQLRVMARHVFPNALYGLIVVASLYIATAIRTEAGLSFLGLGVPPPTPSWGNILSDGRQYIKCCPWIATFSGLAIMLAVLAFNLCGDGLRSVLDPQLRGR